MWWMLAEHWDSAFRTKALTCPAPGASGCYCLTALFCSGHWAQPKGISDLVQSKPAHQEPPTSKEEMMQECRARLLCLTWAGVGNDNSFQYCFLKNSMERGACWATVHVVPKSQTWLNLHKHNAYIYWPFLGPSFLLGNLDFPLALFIFWPKNFLNVSCNEVYCWGILWLLNIWKSLLHISFEKYFWGVLKSRCTIFFFWIL